MNVLSLVQNKCRIGRVGLELFTTQLLYTELNPKVNKLRQHAWHFHVRKKLRTSGIYPAIGRVSGPTPNKEEIARSQVAENQNLFISVFLFESTIFLGRWALLGWEGGRVGGGIEN